MHGLRLIKFPDSNTPIEDIKAKNNSKLLVQQSSLKDEIVPEIFKPQMYNTLKRTNAVRVETVQRLRAENQRKAIHIQKSLSEMFGRPSYDIPTKKTLRKLQSILSRKRKVLSNTTLSIGTAKEKWRKINKQKNKIKRKEESRVRENKPKNENIKVLFMSKNWKSRKLRSLLSYTKDIRKNANHYNSKSSCDLDLLRQKNTNFCCRLNIPQVKPHHKNTNSKRYLESCGHKYCRHFYSDHAIRPKNTTEKDCCHHNGHKLSGTYNVVDFPCITAKVPEKTNVCEGTLTHEFNIQSPCKNKQLAIAPSCHYSKGGGDATASLIQPKPKLPQNSHHLKSIKISPKCKFKDRRKKALRSSNIRPIFLVNALKYILFGLSIVIWSPCILIISLLWTVTYPMRPQEIIDTVNDVESCKYDTCDHYDENNCLYSIYNCVVAAIKKLLDVYEAVSSLLKKDQGKYTCQRVHSCSLLSRLKDNHIVNEYPNPRKRYKLLYDINRGWVIKPTKRRKDNCCDPFKKEDLLKKRVAPEVSETNYENELQKLKRAIPKNEPNDLLQCPVLSGNDTPKMRDQEFQSRHKNNTCEREEIVKYQEYGQATKNIPNETQNHINMSMNIVDKNYTCGPNSTIKNEYLNKKYTCETPQRESQLYESNKFHERTQVRFLETNLCSKHVLQNVLSPFHPEYYSNQHERLSKLPNQNIMTSRWPSHRCKCKLIKRKQKCNHQKNVYPRNMYGTGRNIKGHIATRPRCSKYDRAKINQSKCKKSFIQHFRDFQKKTIGMIKDADNKVWNCDKCENLYDQTLQKRPWSWVHRRWPTFYPYFLIFCKFYENLAYAMLYIFTACIWCPIFCWCYMCCNFFCRCIL